MTGDTPPTASLRLPARLGSIPALRHLALDWAARAGLDGLALQRLDLVLEEALVNVINHAYGAGQGDLELACRAEAPGRVCLTLTDWGPPFDPLHGPDPDREAQRAANREAGLDGRAPGGLGLFFIRGMAQASYRREAGANVLDLCVGP